MQTKSKYFIGILAFLVISASFIGGAVADRLFVIKPLNYLIPRGDFRIGDQTINQKILQEESVVMLYEVMMPRERVLAVLMEFLQNKM